MEECDPCGVVIGIQAILVDWLHDEVEGLREPKEEDDVDDREGEHVSSDHGEDHGDERPGQFDCPETKLSSGGSVLRWMLPCKEEKVEPASRDSKDQKGLLDHPVVLGAHYIFRILSILLVSGGALFHPYIFRFQPVLSLIKI